MKNVESKSREDLTAMNKAEDQVDQPRLDAPVPEALIDNDGRRRRADAAIETIRMLRGRLATGGRGFTRDEMNERGTSPTERTEP